MDRKEKRSMILSLVLGDGNLYNIKNNGKLYGLLTIDHGVKQADYQAWKAQLLSSLLNKKVRVRPGHKGKSVQVQVCWKRMRAWKRFIYKDKKKDLTRILPFITNPTFAVSVWLMDDGYVEPSFSKLKNGTKKNYGARFRIFTLDQNLEQHEKIVTWFEDSLGVTPKIKIMKDNRKNKQYYFLKFTQEDSLKIWKDIREFVLQFKSMQYKFRYIEQIYQKKMS
jgi:hypothetical protein